MSRLTDRAATVREHIFDAVPVGALSMNPPLKVVPAALALDFERDAKRYRWIRQRGAWETESFLNGLTPEEYDAALDKAMAE